jgi:hypothetical protein
MECIHRHLEFWREILENQEPLTVTANWTEKLNPHMEEVFLHVR